MIKHIYIKVCGTLLSYGSIFYPLSKFGIACSSISFFQFKSSVSEPSDQNVSDMFLTDLLKIVILYL